MSVDRWYLRTVTPVSVPADPSRGTLERIVRKPHRGHEGDCAVRDYPPSVWWRRNEDRPRDEKYWFPWCPNKANWRWNEQNLCHEHAAAWALGCALPGMHPDGHYPTYEETWGHPPPSLSTAPTGRDES